MASDGRKRRSFLPAPKKSSGIPAPSTQPNGSSSYQQPSYQPQQHGLQQPQQQYQHHHQQQYQYQQHHQQQSSHLQYQPSHQESRYHSEHQSTAEYQDQHHYHHHTQQQHHHHHHHDSHNQQQPHYHHHHLQQEQQQQQQQQQEQQQQQQQQQEPQQQHQHHEEHQQTSYQRHRSTDGNETRRSSETVVRKSANAEPVYGKSLRVGAKVKIGGIKPGIIRYLGTTHLAPGIFCGIELFESDGSHDGEVNGHRYFSCPPKHGIFAPKEKVCLDRSFSPLARVTDSDVSCSSTESLADKSNEAFRKYSEGDIEAVEVSPCSPESKQSGVNANFSRKVASKQFDLNSTFVLDNEGTQRGSLEDVTGATPGKSHSHRSLLPSLKSYSPQPLCSSSHTRAHDIGCEENYLENVSPILHQGQASPKSFSLIESCSLSSSPRTSNSRSGSGKSSEESEEDGLPRGALSTGVKKQLRGDNRRYLNFTFDQERNEGDVDIHNRTFEVNTISDDENVDALSTTRSMSASDLPPEIIPCVDNDAEEECCWPGSDQSLTRMEGGYSNSLYGDGSNAGLSFPHPVDSLSNSEHSSLAQNTEDESLIRSSQSYTVCTHGGGEHPDNHSQTLLNSKASPAYRIHPSFRPDERVESVKTRHSSTESFGNGGDSSSSGGEPKTESSDGSKGDIVDDSSNGISPEASQTLEWDYGQEFDGKLPVIHSDNTMSASASTGTSESLSDALRDVSEHSDVIEPELASGVSLDSDQFEVSETEFENIDRLEDFTFFGKDVKTIMTDSGISDKDFEGNMAKSSTSTICGSSSEDFSREDDGSVATTKNASSDSSQETIASEMIADTPVSVEVKELPGESDVSSVSITDEASQLDSTGDHTPSSCTSIISVHDDTLPVEKFSPRGGEDKIILTDDVEDGQYKPRPGDELNLADVSGPHMTDLSLGHPGAVEGGKKERPVSLISTASADTGYAPDTDSELGTLTANTPLEWVDRLGVAHPTTFAPQDDDTALASPIDSDLIVKESLALSRALCRPNFGSQSSTTNTSDTEDSRSQNQEDVTSKIETEEGEVVSVEKMSSQMESSILSASMIQDSELVNDSGHGDLSVSVDEEDDRVEADRVLVNGQSENGSKSLADIEESAVDSNAEEKGNGQAKESVAGDGLKEEGSKEDLEHGKKENVTEEDSSQGKRKRKPFVQTKKRMEVIDHKMPNTKVASRLADYIKTPPPTKSKEEKEKEAEEKKKLNKNVQNTIKKRLSVSDVSGKPTIDTSRASSVDKNGENTSENKKEKVEKFEKPKPPVIKRTPPKSKWGNIMSQIDHNKSVKPKPKSEIKSSLAVYLNNPVPIQPHPDLTNAEVMVVKSDGDPNQPPQLPPPKREFKSRIKPLPPPPPKIDLSKVKSKLGAPTAASVSKRSAKREASPAIKLDSTSKLSRDSSPATNKSASTSKKGKESDGKIVLHRKVDAAPSSTRSSRSDLSVATPSMGASSVFDEGTTSKSASTDQDSKRERRQSCNSIKSAHSDKSKSKAADKDVSRTRPPIRKSSSTISPTKRHSRTVEIRLGASPGPSSRHSSTSPTPIVIRAVKPSRPDPKAAASDAAPTRLGVVKSGIATSRGQNPVNLSKPRLPNGTFKAGGKYSSASPGAGSKSKAAQEIERLESLCEARTKELTQTKIQLKASNQAFDAMGVLVNYCCTELNAFECPQLATNLATVQKQLSDCLAEIAELTSQKEKLTSDVSQVTQEKEEAVKKVEETMTAAQSEKEEHARVTKELDDIHNAALTAQRDELSTERNNEAKKCRQQHEQHIQLLKQSHERMISDMDNENKMDMNKIRVTHLEDIQSLRNKHDSQMEELHKQHRNKLEDITHRFETIKLTLTEKVQCLKGECEGHLQRARLSEEALQNDADVKVQMALVPYLALPKEIESLKTVVEMRNEEIQKLRNKNTDLEKQVEEIPIAREKIISLQQKVENLEAIINIKTDHEKQLHEKCQVLMRKYDRENKANKRLSMDYEQVMWRMSQSEFGSSESLTKRQLSRSPPRSETTSPDSRRRIPISSPNGDVQLRVKKRSESESDRNLRSRSATFVLEKDEDIDKLTNSPSSLQSTPQRLKRRMEREERESKENFERRMCQSAGAEVIMSSLNGSKNAWSIEMTGSQSSDVNEEETDCHMMESTEEMIGSYARSLSGVSDSGVCDGLNSGNYDSMTGSELLNSSVFSNDSEWVASANISMTLDSIQDDQDPAPGQEIVNSNTVVDMSSFQSKEGNSSSFSESSSYLSSSTSANETMMERDLSFRVDESELSQKTDYEFPMTLPEEEVFETHDIS